jgi:hypothetical protein
MAAFESYLSAYLDEPKVSKSDWCDCQFPQQHRLLKFCCNTGHALGTFIFSDSSTGSVVAGGYISFSGFKDHVTFFPRIFVETTNTNRNNDQVVRYIYLKDGDLRVLQNIKPPFPASFPGS